MTKSEYAQLLLTAEWNEVRIRILKRDKFVCRHCGAKDCRLSVHHKIYLEGKLPWEVPDKFLISLCDDCHAKAHENRLISSFIKKRVPEEKKKKAKRQVKLRTLSNEEKMFIAKLTVLQRVHPTSNQWTFYKKQLFEYSGLSKDEKAIINVWFNRAKNKAKGKFGQL
jgi:hypothetical protein